MIELEETAFEKKVLHLLPSALHPRFRAGERQAQSIIHILLGETLQLGQQKNFPLAMGQEFGESAVAGFEFVMGVLIDVCSGV